MKFKNILVTTGVLCFLSIWSTVDALAVMSVDIGSEWMKIAIVSPGVPMEIVLNKESKRKTPVAIAFRDGERLFGEDALSVGVKIPQNAIFYILDLLGKTIDNPIVKLYQKRFPFYKLVEDPQRKTILFELANGEQYSVEELVGMILNKAKETAEAFARQPVKEGVITVPAFFNQAERRAMLKAAELGGLKVLQLINSNTAAALNYGIFRRKDFNDTATNILFFDMGASSTVATVAAYQVAKTKERGYAEYHPQVSVLGVGYDRTLGGLEMQSRLKDHLAKSFNGMKKTKNDVFSNGKALAKLFKEAGRVKNVLSANADHFAQVENLMDDQDFRVQVTREEFEKLNADLMERVTAPISRALAAARLNLSQIDHIILVGASTRMPKVQEVLTQYTQRDLGKNLNADEAAALGAVYRAADLSTGYQVKKFLTKDAVLFPVEVDFERELDASEDGRKVVKIVKRTLFPLMNPYPQKKVLTFNKHTEDFTFYVNYGNLSSLSDAEVQALGSLNLTRVDLSGINEILAKHSQDGTEFKGIKAHFAFDDSGILSLSNVETIFEKVQVAAPETNETVTETTNSTEGAEANKTEATNATKTEKKPKVETIKEEVLRKESVLDLADLAEETFTKAAERIHELNEKDRVRREKEQAKNSLETFIFDTQYKVSSGDFDELTTEEERQTINEKCSQLSDWLYEDGDDAEVSVYEAKLGELKSVTAGMYERHKEKQDRPEVLGAFKQMMNASTVFLNKMRNATPDEQYLEKNDLDHLEKSLADIQQWLDEKLKEQEKTPLYKPPVLTAKGVAERMAAVDKEVKDLVSKAKIARAKRLKELAEKLKEFEKKPNRTDEEKKEEGSDKQQEKEENSKEKATEEASDQQTQEQSETEDEHVEL